MSNYADAFGVPKRFGAGCVAASMPAPTAAKDFVIIAPYPEVIWYVKMGANVTSYDVDLCSLARPENGKLGSTFVVVDDTFTVQAGNKRFRQAVWGDPVAIRIYNIVNPDGEFEVQYKGINP